jgi:hypothetical protein
MRLRRFGLGVFRVNLESEVLGQCRQMSLLLRSVRSQGQSVGLDPGQTCTGSHACGAKIRSRK